MNWIEIFRTGTHTDSAGIPRTFNQSDFDRMVASLDTSRHEPPLVLGHPKTDDPAWGWVQALKRNGDVLYATFKNVPEIIQTAIDTGRYKKRSIALFADGRLRHVGLLGAQVPAVEGLQDIVAFNDNGQGYFEFSHEAADYNPLAMENSMTLEELEKRVAKLQAENELLKARQAGASDDQIKELEAAVARLTKEKQEAEAATTEAETAKAETEAAFAAAKADARTKELTGQVDALIQANKILPRDKAKILSFASHLDSAGEFEFASGEGKKTMTAHFLDFLSSLPEHGLEHEYAAPASSGAQEEIPYNDIMNKV